MVSKHVLLKPNWLGGKLQPITFFYHALGLLALGILAKVIPQLPIKTSFLLIQVGIFFFCGSLYVMALGLPRGLGAITPIGGALMIAGWLVLAWNAMKYAK